MIGAATKPPTPKQARERASRLSALTAALTGKAHGSSRSLSASYGLPIPDVQSAMRSMGVTDDAEHR